MQHKVRFEYFCNNTARIVCDDNLFKIIREKFSVKNPSYVSRKKFPRKYIITPAGMFELGLLNDIIDFIKTMNLIIDVEISPDLQKIFSPSLSVSQIQNIDGIEYFDHQYNTIKEFITNGRGCGILATSAGKSILIGGFIKTLLHSDISSKILVIVPNVSLLHQLKSTFIDQCKLNSVTIWGDGNLPDENANILIANTQILVKDIKKSLQLLKHFNYIIIDEVHRLGEKDNMINKVISNIHTPHKFGLTGTLPDNLLAAWNVIGRIGPILYTESSYDIREKGIAAQVRVKILVMKHSSRPERPVSENPDTPLPPTAFFEKETEFIYNNEKRNEVIVNIAKKTNGNILVLVDSIEHGENLFKKLENEQKWKVYFVRGSMNTTERQRIFNEMENVDNVICIAMSQIFSTGISINNLPFVIFTAIGKSNVKVSQSIGRAMRLHHNKQESIIYDLVDTTKYSFEHFKSRLELYKRDKIPFEIKKIYL